MGVGRANLNLLCLMAMAVTPGTARFRRDIAFMPALQIKSQQKQGKNDNGDRECKKEFKHDKLSMSNRAGVSTEAVAVGGDSYSPDWYLKGSTGFNLSNQLIPMYGRHKLYKIMNRFAAVKAIYSYARQ